MQKNMEMEYKFLLSAEQFIDAYSKYGREKSEISYVVQINYYYDTYDNVLNDKNITVRLRQERNNIKWQIKKHGKRSEKNGVLSVSDEYTGTTNDIPKTISVSGINEDLHLKGNLITERKVYGFGHDSKICFDISMYLGRVDYEVEIEYSYCDKDIAHIIVNEIEAKNYSAIPKSKRFFKRLEEFNSGARTIALC